MGERAVWGREGREDEGEGRGLRELERGGREGEGREGKGERRRSKRRERRGRGGGEGPRKSAWRGREVCVCGGGGRARGASEGRRGKSSPSDQNVYFCLVLFYYILMGA